MCIVAWQQRVTELISKHFKGRPCLSQPNNVGIAIINHPRNPHFLGNINHQKWVVYVIAIPTLQRCPKQPKCFCSTAVEIRWWNPGSWGQRGCANFSNVPPVVVKATPSGNQTWLAGKSPMNGSFIRKLTDKLFFSIAMFDYRRYLIAIILWDIAKKYPRTYGWRLDIPNDQMVCRPPMGLKFWPNHIA